MNYHKNIMRIAIVITILAISIISCEDDTAKPYTANYHMRADSMTAKDTINSTEVLDITIYYTVYSSCEKFRWVETSKDSNILNIKLIGQRQYNVSCAAVVENDSTHLPVTGFSSDMYYLKILQPSGTHLIDSVFVLR
jgi:hypothetical protein